MKLRFFAIGIALVAMTGFYSCGDDEVDAPSDGMEQQDPTDPDDSTDPDDGSGDEAGEDPGPFVPPTILEPLSKDVRPELTDGKRWIQKNFLSDGTICEYTFFIDGDIVLNGYKAKAFSIIEGGKYSRECSYRREENGKIYAYQAVHIPGYEFPPEAEFGCDFLLDHVVNPTEGKIYIGSVHDIKLLSRGTMVLQGIERRAVKVEICRSEHNNVGKIDYWVEGIGSLFGVVMDYSYVRPSASYLDYSIENRLMQCYDGDKLIYDYSEFRKELYNEIEVFEYPE